MNITTVFPVVGAPFVIRQPDDVLVDTRMELFAVGPYRLAIGRLLPRTVRLMCGGKTVYVNMESRIVDVASEISDILQLLTGKATDV